MDNLVFDTVLHGGMVMTPSGLVHTDVGIINGRIAEIGDLKNTKTKNTIDCFGLHILPGVIDTQVHFREPGGEHKEDLHTGSLAAVAGGVTGVFEMPNTNPLTTTPETMVDKLKRASGRMYCDYAFYFGGTAENAHQLSEWENLPGVCGIKIFMGASTGNLLVVEDEHIENILKNGRRVVAVHSEDEKMMNENKARMLAENPTPPVAMHNVWRSVEAAVNSTTRLMRIARKTGRRVHVLHISTAEELPILAAHRDVATCEVLPNHLTFAAPECYERLGSLTQQNPPIREQYHQDALWHAVNTGLIDILGSDHAPHTLHEKEEPYPKSHSGTPGVQTMVPVMLNHINNGKMTLDRFVDMTAYGPARVHQIANKGRIAPGYDADFTIVDMNKQMEITNAQQKSRAGWTPYDGMKVTGWPVMTIIRGRTVMRDDEILGEAAGKVIHFRETMEQNRTMSMPASNAA